MNENKNQKDKKKQFYVVLASILLLIAIAILVVILIMQINTSKDTELSYTDLIKQIEEGNVEKVEMTAGSTTAKIKLKDIEEEKTTLIPSTQAFIELIQEKSLEGNHIDFAQKPQNVFVKISGTLFSLLPTILLVILFILLIKLQGLGDKGKVYDAETTKSKIKFDFMY